MVKALATAVVLAAALCAGCAARDYTMLAPRPPAKFEVLGPAEGTGCGSVWIMFFLFDASEENAGYWARYERARKQALSRVPDATSLINVEIRENTTWWLLGATDCITVRGQAIR